MYAKASFAIAAMFAGAAIGVAPASPAPATQMSGHYIAETTTAGGQSSTHDWYFTACGSGCADVSFNGPANPPFRAQLANGQWTVDATFDVSCSDGTWVPASMKGHYVWDATTLSGSAQLTYTQAACGNQPGTQSESLHLKPAT
ncbi:MAG: hypothetical protein JO259_05760 [Mycobacterium sp.]|nr:hypothetical protein [Mycobacterium sp.]